MFTLLMTLAITFSPQSSEETKLQKLHTQAINATFLKDYESAKKSYEEILKLISLSKTDWSTYVDIHLKLAEALCHLKEYSQAKELLSDLLKKRVPSQYLNAIEILQARLDMGLGDSPQAYLTLKKVCERYPLEKWKGEDRSFYHLLEINLNDHYSELKKKAKRFTLAKNYKEAICFYEEILKAIEGGYFPDVAFESILHKKIRYHLAENLFFDGCFEKTLQNLDPEENATSDEIFLAARCYKEKKEYTKALEYFKKYLASGKKEDLKNYLQAYLETALAYFACENYEMAQAYFQTILESKKTDRIQKIATLYLAKIHLKKEDLKQSELLLSQLALELPKTDSLQFEISYLRGLLAYKAEDMAQAAQFFEACLATNEFHEWSKAALFKLAQSYNEMMASPLQSKKAKEDLFEKSHQIYQKLATFSKHESLLLAQSYLLVSKNKYLQDESAVQEAKQLLISSYEGFSDNAKIQALIMLAEIECDPVKQKKLLEEASSSAFEKTELYPQSWYLLGLFELSSGHFERAEKAFSKAFSLYEKKDQLKAKQSLQAEAKAQFFLKAPLLSLQTTEKLFAEFDLKDEEKEELLYLRGLFASKIETQSEKTISSLNDVSILYPRGKYSPSAKYVLGCYYLNQKDYQKALSTFFELEKSFEDSPFAGDSLFWAAEILEKLCPTDEKILPLRQKCYQKYQTCPLAPYAYLKKFTFEQYQAGDFDALSHLKAFADLFPSSELLTIVYFFLGQNESNVTESLSYYKKAYLEFDESKKTLSLLYFKNRSMIEAAMLMISHNEFESAANLLEKVISEFKDNKEASFAFKEKSSYPSVLEEASFAMCQLLIKQNENKKAKALLLEMLENYKKAGIVDGYFLAHVWQELGKMAMNANEFQTAYECFEEAYECGERHLYPDQRLNLWILQSDCQRMQNKNEMALRLLSKVINEDVVSMLRLKAMFLRAEIYEKEGKHEWAIRQLESLAKKGGPWGEKAEEKLRDRYAIR